MSDFDKDAQIHHFKQSMREMDLAIVRLKREKELLESNEVRLRKENEELYRENGHLRAVLAPFAEEELSNWIKDAREVLGEMYDD